MDQETRTLLTALAKGHDEMTVRLAALTAIVGAMVERSAPDEKRIIAWAQAIAEQSEDQSQTAIQRMTMDIIRGLPTKPADTTQNSGK
jgi:hypothetical protein